MKKNRMSGSKQKLLLCALLATSACTGEVLIGGGSEPDEPGGSGTDGTGGSLLPGDGGLGEEPECNGTGGGLASLELTPPSPSETDQVDILFVVDNSHDAREHHQHFIQASTELIERLARPRCAGTNDPVSAEGTCPDGAAPEFAGVTDIHVGVITTSLGLQPGIFCKEEGVQDRAHLIPKVRHWVDDPTGSGVINYNGDLSTLDAVKDQVRSHIEAAGKDGCGYESPLEAAYRFLVDPKPAESFELENSSFSTPVDIDHELLKQRAAFLRPSSAVLVVLLASEDDCSMMGGDSHYENARFGWLTNDPNFSGLRATKQCADDPNDPCCMSCLQNGSDACDPMCAQNVPVSKEEDPASLRCFDQKRRFGLDLLYPKERYIDGFSRPIIPTGRCGDSTQNPLFVSENAWTRSPDKVFLTSIVGAPWQDLSTQESLTDADTLEYLSSSELSVANVAVDGENVSRWDLLVGSPEDNQAPYDPFMIGSIAPRRGTHPLVPATITGPNSSGGNPINGHEYDTSVATGGGQYANNDLQYACISALETPRSCDDGDTMCTCAFEPGQNRPVCKAEPQADLEASTTQYFAGAYPAPRILEVTRGLRAQGIPASICAKSVDPESDAYGYRPAVNATLSRMTPILAK